MQNVLRRPRRRSRWETRWDISISNIKPLNSFSVRSIKCVKAYAASYVCRTQQEIVLIKHSDVFYTIPSGSPAIVNGRIRLTNISLLKLEVRTNQSHTVCTWRVVKMSSSTDDGSSWCVLLCFKLYLILIICIHIFLINILPKIFK